jgi:hypothetical protein
LPAILAFLCCGMLCGNRSLLAIAEWGRAHEAWCCATFGFSRRTPCVSTLHRVLKGLDVVAFEAALRAWLLPQLEAPLPLEPVAIDGKAVRGAKDQHLPGSYQALLAAGDEDHRPLAALARVDGEQGDGAIVRRAGFRLVQVQVRQPGRQVGGFRSSEQAPQAVDVFQVAAPALGRPEPADVAGPVQHQLQRLGRPARARSRVDLVQKSE